MMKKKLEEYLKQVVFSNKYISLNGIPLPKGRDGRLIDIKIPLENIYIQLQAIEEKQQQKQEEIEKKSLEKNYLSARGKIKDEILSAIQTLGEYLYRQSEIYSSEKRPEPISANEIIKKHSRTVVLGAPGSGKSTLLNYLAHHSAKDELSPTPVKIVLKEYATALINDPSLNIISFVLRKLKGYGQDLPVSIGMQIKQNNIIWLLDGLDETRDMARQIAREISLLPGKIVLTSRPIGYIREGLEEFQHFEILPLVTSDVDQFLHNWFMALASEKGYNKEWVTTRIKWLDQQIQTRKSLKRLTYNPLLLTFLVILAGDDTQSELPSKRHELYRRYIEELLNQREINRIFIHSNEPNSNTILGEAKIENAKQASLETFYYLGWLLQLAYFGGKERPLPTHTSLKKMLAMYLDFSWSSNVDETINATQVLWEGTGLIDFWKLGDEKYLAFRHLTFQEFGAAWVLNKSWNMDAKQTWRFIEPRLYDPAWREVILLFAEMLTSKHLNIFIINLLRHQKSYDKIIFRNIRLAADILSERNDVDLKLQKIVFQTLKKHYYSKDYWKKTRAIEAIGRFPYNEGHFNLSDITKVGFLKAVINLLKLLENSIFKKYLLTLPIEELVYLINAEIELSNAIPSVLRKALQSEDAEISTIAAATLSSKSDNLLILSELLATAKHSGTVSNVLANSLKKSEKNVIPLLIDMLTSDESDSRRTGAVLIREVGSPNIIPLLIYLTEDEDYRTVSNAKNTLNVFIERGIFQNASYTELLSLLDSKNSYIKLFAAFALSKIKTTAVVDELTKVLFLIEEKEVSQHIANFLIDMGQIAFPAIYDLIQENERALKNGYYSENIKIHASLNAAIKRIDQIEYIPFLINLLKFEGVKASAIFALGNIKHPSTTTYISMSLIEKDSKLRQVAVEALGNLQAVDFLDHIILMLQDEDLNVRKSAVIAIGKIGDKRSIKHLILKMKDRNWELRRIIIETLAKFDDAEVNQIMLETLHDESLEVSLRAAEVVRDIRDPLSIPYLLNMYTSKNKFNKIVALFAMSGFDDNKIINACKESINQTKEEGIRQAAIIALATIAQITTSISVLKQIAALFFHLNKTKELENTVYRLDTLSARNNASKDPATLIKLSPLKKDLPFHTITKITLLSIIGITYEVIINLVADHLKTYLPSTGQVFILLILVGITLGLIDIVSKRAKEK